MAINNIGKTAYIYQNGTWYAISGAANTALNYTWSGTHTYGAPVTTNDVINAKAGVNNFNNPSHRDQVLTQPVRGLVCFIAENENSVRVDQLQYFDGSIWQNISGYKTITSKLSSYTLTAADNSRVITVDSSSATTITVPANLTTAIPVGYSVDIIQLGTGSTTISPESVSVSVKSKNNVMSLDGQFSKATLIKLDTNTWSLSGDIYENVAPTPTAPTPTAPTPTAPTPTAPTPTAPTPTAPTPTAPTPTAPTPTAPTPTAPTPTAPTLSVSNLSSIVTGESTAAISWDSTGQQSFLLMVVPRFSDQEPGFTLSGTTEKFASATGLTPGNVHDITLYVYSGANQTGSFQLAQSTLTTPGPIGVNTYTFTYYDGKCNYQVKNSSGTYLRDYSTNLCTNSGVDETGATLPNCSQPGCTTTPTPTAPTPTAPTPTAPTPTAPTPTAPTGQNTYTFTYYDGKCNYAVYDSNGQSIGSYSTNLCSNTGVDSSGAAYPSCSNPSCTPTPTPTAPTPTAPTPTAPTPTAPTPTAPTPTAPTPTAPTPTAPTPTAPTPTAPVCTPGSTPADVTTTNCASLTGVPGCTACQRYIVTAADCSTSNTWSCLASPTAPTPTAPTPTAPTPTAPTPTAPTPTAPTPTAPTPTAPTPTAPTPTAVTYSTNGPSLATVTCANGGTTNSQYISNPGTYSISNGVCGTVGWYAYTTGTWYVGCCAN